MTANRIRELRLAAGLTQEQLSERVNISVANISRMENGKRGVSQKNARKIATALGKREAEVLGYDDGKAAENELRALRDELLPYQPGPEDPFHGLKSRTRHLMKVRTSLMERKGISDGDVVVVDGSAETCKNPPPLAAVQVRYHYDKKRPAKVVTLIRQFVPPSLLITNAAGRNAASIDLEKDRAEIVGVIISSHRALNS